MELRHYQQASIDGLRNGFKSGHARQILALATGGGKTITASELIKLSIAKGSKVGIFCERRKLVEQFSKTLDFLSIDHGIMMAGHWRYRPQSHVQILSIQTFARMERFPHFDIVVIDEVHAAMHKTLQKYLDARPEVKVVGLSATPFSAILPKYFTNIINPITMRELVDEGSLLPYKVFIAHEVDTDGVKVSSTGEWDAKQLEQRASVVVGDVVSDYLSIGQRLYGRKTKSICFSAGIAHGTELVNRFLEVGVMAAQLTHKNNEEEKQEIFKEFDKHDSVIDVLISAEMLQRGFDNTSVEHVILAKPIRKSFSSFVQMIGRGARPHNGQSFCIIQDNGGNWMRFNEDWNKLYGDGVTELVGNGDEKTRKEKTAKEKEAAKCPVCFALWTGSLICPVCGHVKKQQAMVEEVAGEIIEFNGIVEKKEKFSSEYKEAFYQGLIGYARSKGFKDGWAWHNYQAKFNVQPTWKKVAGEVTVDVMNHIKHQAIKRAKGAKK